MFKSELNNLVLKSKAHCFHIQMREQFHRVTNLVKAVRAVMFTTKIYLASLLSVRDSFSSKQKTL